MNVQMLLHQLKAVEPLAADAAVEWLLVAQLVLLKIRTCSKALGTHHACIRFDTVMNVLVLHQDDFVAKPAFADVTFKRFLFFMSDSDVAR